MATHSVQNDRKQVYVQLGHPFNVGAFIDVGCEVDIYAGPSPNDSKKRPYSLRVLKGGLALDTIKHLLNNLRNHGKS